MKKRLLVITLLFAALFIILTFLVQIGVFNEIDLSVTKEFQKIIPRSFDLPLSVFSVIGKVEIVGTVLLLLVAIIKGLNKLLILFLFGFGVALEYLVKLFVVQNPPPIQLLRTINLFNVPTDQLPHGTYAYPSGHAMRFAFISAVLLFVIWNSKKLNREMKYILSLVVVFIDFLMFGSRVYLGEHWATDVIGGIFLGLCLFSAGILISRRFFRV